MQALPPKRRPIYHNKHYKFRFLLKNKEFIKEIEFLKNKFRRFDAPIPQNGFNSYEEYEQWNKKYWEIFSQYASGNKSVSKLLKDYWNKLSDENNRLDSKNFDSFLELKENIFPPVYKESIEKIVEKFGYNPKDKEIKDFIFSYLFFNKQIPKEEPFKVVHKRNHETNKFEVFIQIYPWTTRDDISKNWSFIEQEKSYYPENRSKNNQWFNYEKDTDIYTAYETVKKKKVYSSEKETIPQIAYNLLKEKYPRLTLEKIKKVHNNVKKRLSN